MGEQTKKSAVIDEAMQAIQGIAEIKSPKEFAALPNVLEVGELPQMAIKCACVATGVGNGLMVATDRRVVYLRSGRSLRLKDMAYSTMTSIDAKNPGGNITFYGTAEKLDISYTTKSLTLAFAEFVRAKIGRHNGNAITVDESIESYSTTDSKPEIIGKALQTVDGFEQTKNANEVNELTNVLAVGELPKKVVKCSTGNFGSGLMVATDRRVVYLHKGRKLDVRYIPYSEMRSIETKLDGANVVYVSAVNRLDTRSTNKAQMLEMAEFVRQNSNITDNTVAGESKTAAIMDAIRSIDTSGTYPNKWEVRKLPEILDDGELPRMITSGSYKGTRSRSAGIGVLVATDRRVLFIDKGLFNSLTVEDFPYSRIQSVEANTGMMWGTIVIKSAGNAEEIGNVAKERTHEFASMIRENVRESQPTPSVVAPVAVAPPVSVADELLKLAQLRDAGILTDEEFEAQKAKLLG